MELKLNKRKNKMTTIKFSKAFGEVEILNQDENFTTIVVFKTGEQKKLSTKFANLSDEPFTKAKQVKKVKRELTQEEKLHLEYINRNGDIFIKAGEQSHRNIMNGKAGSIHLTK